MSQVVASHSPRGSLWHRWDLHFHSPSSFDHKHGHATDSDIVERLVAEQLRVVAITDHHRIDVARIRHLQELGRDRLTVLPGIELRDDHGAKPIHYIGLFPEYSDLEHVWDTLKGGLGLTPKAIRDKGGDERIYVPIRDGASAVRKLGGVISLHAGAKSNSIEGIENKEKFQQRIKYDITSEWVDLLEIGQIKDIDRYLGVVFPQTGLEKPLIACSDNHDIRDYFARLPLWIRADPTFRGLLMAILEPRDRLFLGAEPELSRRVRQNPTKFIQRISFARASEDRPDEVWFHGALALNPGLIAVVGNKGSGKSALSDTIGLVGSSHNDAYFSFLNDQKFRHPRTQVAELFEAELTWESGEVVRRNLADRIRPEEIERVRYLPQDHVEQVCTALAVNGGEDFERELKAVIFSRLNETERLDLASLDELIRFRTDEKARRMDALLRRLRGLSRRRAVLEARALPSTRAELNGKLERLLGELEAHELAKPAERSDPAQQAPNEPVYLEIARQLTDLQDQRRGCEADLASALERLRLLERRAAVAERLHDRLENIRQEAEEWIGSLHDDARELGVDPAELVQVRVTSSAVASIVAQASADIATVNTLLEGDDPPGLRRRAAKIEAREAELRLNLDAPNRAYREYLDELQEWERRREAIVGNASQSDSLEGLRSALGALDALPEEIAEVREAQLSVALHIHSTKQEVAETYSELHAPVQEFINSHPIARGQLALEFKADLLVSGFADRLLPLIAKNRRGTFMGIDEGKRWLEERQKTVDWHDADQVRAFLEDLDHALYHDMRDEKAEPVQLADQLARSATPEHVFDLLFGLDYLKPRYVLRWEGKELSMLSAGERGTLLLVFYLLIDQSDQPLVIDQPEGNLDNHTVARILVHCLRETRSRRQVLIVTHNPNLAVVCDADQVIHASIDKARGNEVTYTCGALENPAMNRFVTDVLEGTRWAFGIRGDKYNAAQGPDRPSADEAGD